MSKTYTLYVWSVCSPGNLINTISGFNQYVKAVIERAVSEGKGFSVTSETGSLSLSPQVLANVSIAIFEDETKEGKENELQSQGG